jgi:DNA primase
MNFPPELLDEIRVRLPVSHVVGRKVTLRKTGREWTGLSPFNKEKTPSFKVNDQKGFYHCFSSGKHGDIFTFVMEVDGLSFPEAVERLASQAGVPLPAATPEAKADQERKRTLHEVCEIACRFFQEQLRLSAMAQGYLVTRKIERETQDEFRIGYAPTNPTALQVFMQRHNIPLHLLADAGLVIKDEKTGDWKDKFRGRVMFPISDMQGGVIAFSGRALGDAQPKYLNSPETPIFVKGNGLFNLHRARSVAHDVGTFVVVEGNVDVVTMVQAGFGHTIAPLGTALTKAQLDLMWRHVSMPIFCFDADRGGRSAAYRAIDVALPGLQPGKSIRFAMLPEGLDPDGVVRTMGARTMVDILKSPANMEEMIWRRETERSGALTSPDARADLEKRLNAVVDKITSRVLALQYRHEFRGRLAQLNPYLKQRGLTFPRRRVMLPPPPPSTTKDRYIAAICLARPDLVDRYVEQITAVTFCDEKATNVITELVNAAQDGRHTPIDIVRGSLLSDGTLRNLILTNPNHDDVEGALREMLGLERL